MAGDVTIFIDLCPLPYGRSCHIIFIYIIFIDLSLLPIAGDVTMFLDLSPLPMAGDVSIFIDHSPLPYGW